MKKALFAATALSVSLTACGFFGGSDEVEVAAVAPVEAAPEVVENPYNDVVLNLPRDYRAQGPYMISDRLGQEDQVIVLYANATARYAAKGNGTLPYESVLIGEVYGAKKDANGVVIESQVGRRLPGELKAIVMMERREGWDAQYPEELKVGDWEFEVFSPTGENLAKNTIACRECHHPLTDSEFVFSYDHIGAAN